MNALLEFWEQQRMKLWCEVWSATASAIDCKHPSSATKFADEAMKAFEQRFPKPIVD